MPLTAGLLEAPTFAAVVSKLPQHLAQVTMYVYVVSAGFQLKP